MADSLLEAAQLAEVMADVNDVKAAPLVGAQGSEEEVRGDALNPEAMLAAVDEGVHLIDFLAQHLEELGAGGGRPVELIGAGEDRGGNSVWHLAETEHDHL